MANNQKLVNSKIHYLAQEFHDKPEEFIHEVERIWRSWPAGDEKASLYSIIVAILYNLISQFIRILTL
jgi:hypothetical protein